MTPDHVKMYNKNVSLSVRSKGHFFWSLSIHSKGNFLGHWEYAQRVIFWVIEHALKGSFFGSLSVRSKGNFLGHWAYAIRVIFWVIEHTFKGSFLGSMSICSKGYYLSTFFKPPNYIALCLSLFEVKILADPDWFLGDQQYAKGPKKLPFERMLNDPKMTLLAYTQWPKMTLWDTLKDTKNVPLSVSSMTQKITHWAYTQRPKKWPFEHTLNCCLSICSRT